jgi:hypothetical protein
VPRRDQRTRRSEGTVGEHVAGIFAKLADDTSRRVLAFLNGT